MSSRYSCRWKIFFLIFSLAFRSPAISFTIGRSSNLTADLLEEESSQLEVKHDFKSADVRNNNEKVSGSFEDSLPSKSSIIPAKNTWVSGTTSTLTDSTMTLTIQNSKEINTEPYISAAEVVKPRLNEVSENLSSNNTNKDFNSFLLVNTTEIDKNNELSAVTESVIIGSGINEMETSIGIDSTSSYTTTLVETTEVTSSDKSRMKINGTDTSQNFTNHIEIASESIDSVDNVSTNMPTEGKVSDKTEKMVTKNNRVTLEEAFGMTSDITSLEQLKNDFIALTRKLPTENPLYVKGFTVTDPFEITKKIPETTNTISILILTNKTNLPKSTTPKTSNFENMSAKMGGFMNILSSEIHSSVEATTSVAYTDAMEVKLNETEMYGNMFEMEMDNEGVDNKNISGAESQSQLVDDAIKEELLIEETLSDNKENNHKRLSQENVTEQMLNVKPIPRGSDKKNIYTVSPLYKPLNKKVFLPPKPFIRDPDDNRWRNESLSSLGITFNAKNSSKSFTQVLKNKTEMELKNLLEKENKNEDGKQELRQRLEKMAELRKSKKKKFDDGTYYNDYEENVSTETAVKPKSETLAITAATETTSTTTTSVYPSNYLFKSLETSTYPTTHEYDGYSIHNGIKSTKSPKKFFNAAEYYDNNDDADVDYMTGLDLKKFTIPFRLTNTRATPPTTRTTKQHLPDRKATIQHFPATTQKVNINDYDDEFQRKVNSFTVMEAPRNVVPVTFVPSTSTAQSDGPSKQKQNIMDLTYNPLDLNRDLYLPQGYNQNVGYTIVDRDDNLDKNSYIIKPYRNYFNVAAKEHDSDRTTEYIPTFTPVPMRGVTADDASKTTKDKFSDLHGDYEYDMQFRKDVLDRFADNFNQHSERYKVDFPVIYNNSVIHKKTSEDGKVVASSSAFMRRLYDLPSNKYELSYNKPYDPNCDNVTVELSPAYELHYYVPDEEEKEVLDPRSTLTYAFRL